MTIKEKKSWKDVLKARDIFTNPADDPMNKPVKSHIVPWPDNDSSKTYENIEDAKKVADMLAAHPDGWGDYWVVYVNEKNADDGYTVTDDNWNQSPILHMAKKVTKE